MPLQSREPSLPSSNIRTKILAPGQWSSAEQELACFPALAPESISHALLRMLTPSFPRSAPRISSLAEEGAHHPEESSR